MDGDHRLFRRQQFLSGQLRGWLFFRTHSVQPVCAYLVAGGRGTVLPYLPADFLSVVKTQPENIDMAHLGVASARRGVVGIRGLYHSHVTRPRLLSAAEPILGTG